MVDNVNLALADALPDKVTGGNSAGIHFCAYAGFDEAAGEYWLYLEVNEGSYGGRSNEQNKKESETMAKMFRTIYEFPKPTIAAVNGAALAGGTGLATLCDFTLAVPDAKFGYTEVKIGFIPAIVSSFLLRQLGEKQARDLLLTGRIVDAEDAQRLGLVNEVVEPEKLIQHARDLATQLLQNSPASLSATKRLLSGYAIPRLDAQLKAAVEENAAIRQTDDFREGLSSFLEKRRPNWTGK